MPGKIKAHLERKTTSHSQLTVLTISQVYGGYTWLVTFMTNLADVTSLTADIKTMTGTTPVLSVSESVQGVEPPFSSLDPYNSLPLGSATLTDLSDLSMTVSGLEEGVAYYFRVTASNYIGPGVKPNPCQELHAFRHCTNVRAL